MKPRADERSDPKATLAGKRVVLGVTGSIAAYKAAEICSRLVQRGALVDVVMTKAATEFVGPLTFQTLTRRRVMIDQFDLELVIDATHLSLTDQIDLLLVAPATANFLGKAACGIADDMLTSVLISVTCPVLIAPAMNERMWKNKMVQANVKKLREAGYRFIEPETGWLAEGTRGVGRLADPERILSEAEAILVRK